MARPNYGLLREAHHKALEENLPAIDQTQQPDVEIESPTRPEGHYGPLLGWTAFGGLVEHQASANAWIQANHERQTAHDALEQHIDGEKSATPAAMEAGAASWQRDLGEGIAAREVTGPAPPEAESESLSM
jgi:hypothetical protein